MSNQLEEKKIEFPGLPAGYFFRITRQTDVWENPCYRVELRKRRLRIFSTCVRYSGDIYSNTDMKNRALWAAQDLARNHFDDLRAKAERKALDDRIVGDYPPKKFSDL